MDNNAQGDAALPSNWVGPSRGLDEVRSAPGSKLAHGMRDLPLELLLSVLRRVSRARGLGGHLHFALVCRRFAAARFQAAVLLTRVCRRSSGPVLASELQVYQGPTTLHLSHQSVCGLRALWLGLSTKRPSLTAIRVRDQDDTCLQCEGTCQHLETRLPAVYHGDSQLCGRHGQASAGWAFSGPFLRAHPGLRSISIQGYCHGKQVSTDCRVCSLWFHGPDSAVTIPELRSRLSRLRHLTLKSVNLCWPQDWLSALPPLKSLCLWNTYFAGDISRTDLDIVLSMTSLTSLGLGFGWEAIRGGDFGRLTNLRSLSLQLGQLYDRHLEPLAPASIWALTGLTRLWLDYPGPIPRAGLGRLVGLKVLKVRGVDHQSLPCNLRAPETASFKFIRRLESIGECTSLRSLKLDAFDPNSIPSDLGHLVCLTKLELISLRKVVELPNGFGRLTGLKKLSILRCFKLRELPADFDRLESLTDLCLKILPMLEELPHGFGRLAGLKNISMLSGKKLRDLPADFGQLASLTELRLGSLLKLEELPHGFGRLAGLERLSIFSSPGLRKLPADFGHLVSLTDLHLEFLSELQELSHGFGRLVALRNLTMVKCTSLRNLPADFGQLASLTDLHLEGLPELKELPRGFGRLEALRRLKIVECPSLRKLPADFSRLTSWTE